MKKIIWEARDAGCIAEGSSGAQHVRNTLAALLAAMEATGARVPDGIIRSLETALPEDPGAGTVEESSRDEYRAIDFLNAHCWECGFEYVDGDLMLVADY